MKPEVHFVVQLVQGIKIARLHDLTNRAVQEPLEALERASHELAEQHGSFEIMSQSGVLCFNGKAMKIPRLQYSLAQDLIKVLRATGIQALRFQGALEREQTRELLIAFLEARDADPKVAFTQFSEKLDQSAQLAAQLSITTAPENDRIAFVEVEVTDEELVRISYAKLLVLLKDYVKAHDQPELRNYFNFRLRRTVQVLVKALPQTKDLLRALVTLPSPVSAADRPYAALCTQVVLSILTGNAMGLSDAALVDLSLSSAFHRIGRLLSAGEVAVGRWQGQVGGQEYVRAIALFLGQRQLHGTLLTKLIAVYEVEFLNQLRWQPHLYSRIVSVLSIYSDALLDGRAEFPDDALRVAFEIARERGEIDYFIVRALANGLGILPMSSVIRLADGRYGVVVDNNSHCLHRPRISVFLDSMGQATDYRLVDLSERDEDGKWRHEVAEIYAPGEAPVTVPQILLS